MVEHHNRKQCLDDEQCSTTHSSSFVRHEAFGDFHSVHSFQSTQCSTLYMDSDSHSEQTNRKRDVTNS